MAESSPVTAATPTITMCCDCCCSYSAKVVGGDCDCIVYLTKLEMKVAMLCAQAYEQFRRGHFKESSKIYGRALRTIRATLDSVGRAVDRMYSAQQMGHHHHAITSFVSGTQQHPCSCGCGYKHAYCPSLMIDPQLFDLHKVRFVSSSKQHQQDEDMETEEPSTLGQIDDGDVEMDLSSPSPSSWIERYCRPLRFPVQLFSGNDNDHPELECQQDGTTSHVVSKSRNRIKTYRQLKHRASILSLLVMFNVATVLQRMEIVESMEERRESTSSTQASSPCFVTLYRLAFKMLFLQDDDSCMSWMTSPKQYGSFITRNKRIKFVILNNLGHYVKMRVAATRRQCGRTASIGIQTTTSYSNNNGNGQHGEEDSRQFFENLYVELLKVHQEREGVTTRNGCRGSIPALHDFTNHEPDFDLQGLVDCIIVELQMISPPKTAPAPAA